jgi:ATP phosphoribosyltransferase
MNGALILALPSKGRLQEEAEILLAGAGFHVEKRGGRNYRGTVAGQPGIEVAFLSASEIARELAAGNAHLGITGEDLVRESVADADKRIALLAPLGFGHADVVVAVPELWIDVWTMEDLDDVAAGFLARHGRRLRVATKYWNLTQSFFAGHGIALYRIVESLGATEGAPAAGTADAIVDITTTGSTLLANHLKVLEDGVVLRSQANLAMSLTAPWVAEARQAAALVVAGLWQAGIAVDRAAFAKLPPSEKGRGAGLTWSLPS